MNLQDFTYTLPPERIALHPLSERDKSRLLVYKRGAITHSMFSTLPDRLPDNAFLFFNNTKVIPARLYFTKDTGATIEIFLLHPVTPSPLLVEVMNATSVCSWHCTIGNLKRWKADTALTQIVGDIALTARLLDREQGVVEFSWGKSASFAEVVRKAGETPLPPYLKRKPEASDADRYQTVYSALDGAVAAPTAGLHFTPSILERIRERNIPMDFLTLHVSAGTFQPIKEDDVTRHVMHQEQIVVTRANLENLLQDSKFVIPVGTTSMRTLESLYWYGAKLLQNNKAPFFITQHDPYTTNTPPNRDDALKAVLDRMKADGLQSLTGETSIFIRPGYTFRICQGLITNFHQPASTLILLVAAFIGDDWRKVYDEALKNDYRFLSYGDSSLLIPGSASQAG